MSKFTPYETVSIGRKFAKSRKYLPSESLLAIVEAGRLNPDFGRLGARLIRLANMMALRKRKNPNAVTLADFDGMSYSDFDQKNGVGRGSYRLLTGLRAGADEIMRRDQPENVPLSGQTVIQFPKAALAVAEIAEQIEMQQTVEKMEKAQPFIQKMMDEVGHKPVDKSKLIDTLKDEMIRMSEDRSNYESGRISAFMDVIKMLGQSLTDVPVEFQPYIVGLIIKVSEMHNKVGRV